jgi:hypothetical protein
LSSDEINAIVDGKKKTETPPGKAFGQAEAAGPPAAAEKAAADAPAKGPGES